MAMFGVSGRESYDSLYGVLNQAPDTTALEREQAPGVFAGSMTEAIGTGVYRGWSRGAATLGNVATPALRPIAKSIDEIFGSKTDDWLLGEQEKANRALTESKLDPKTNGAASQLLYGLSDVLTTVIATRGYAPAAGGLFGVTQAQIGMAEGLDTNTALAKGAIEGLGLGVGVALAPAYGSTLTQKLLTGAGINTAIGIGTRAPVSVLLNARGYPEMAKQYAPFDATSLATDLVLGAAFGGLYRAPVKGKAPVQVPPEAIAPSTVDAALTANQARHAEIDAAPGVPVDTRSRQAHNAALDSAVESLAMGRDVNVEALLKDAGFIGKRPDFDALKVIADELDKAGAADVVAKVRAIEAEARSRGLYVEPDTLDSVVLSEKPAAVQVAGQAGRESDVRIGDDVVPTRLMLVEAGDVAATMNKAENQYRDRTRLASEQQIQDIAARLDSRLLMDAPVMDYGAPVLSADGVVIGGNGRAAAIGLAYERGSAASYRDALRAEFGDAVDGMQRPMLVRVLQRDVDVARAAILSNEGQALRMSALEQAKVDAERLGDFRAFEFGDDGAVDLVSNMGFIRAWAEQMPPGQRAAIMDADGKLSAEGAGRLRNAILYRAYGDSPTLARLVEATDPGSRNIAAALTRVAPAVADAREAIDRGDLYPMGLHDDLVASVEKLDALRRQGMSVTDWMKQIDAFGDGMTAEARLLVQFMDANIRAPRAISDGVLGFYARLNEAGNPKQGSMFEASLPDKGRMLTLALDDPGPMYSRLQTETPAFKAWFGDSKVVDADGKPLVVYHGTASDFSAFSKDVEAKHIELPGFYFTPETAYADRFAESAGKEFRDDDGYIAGSEGANVVPVYLSIRNPATIDLGDSVFGGAMTSAKEVKKMLDAAKAAGHDGAIIKDWADGSGPIQYVAFTSTQIKSATGNRGTFDPADADITYGRGAGGRSTATDLVTTLRAMFGKDADRLISTGKLRIVQSVSDLPGSGHPSDVGGMFWQGRAWIVADNTSLSQIRGRVLHEIGEHAGMEQMLGPDLYAETLRRIEAKVATDPVFAEARALAEARANKPEHVPAETLAYLVENAPELPVVRRVLAMVRQWLYRTTGGRFIDLNQADLQMMAVASLRRYAREEAIAERGGAPWYMTLFQGTPHVFQPEPGAPLGRLRWDKINTGEGAQVFGYGHYLAQQEWIARTRYRDRLVKRNAAAGEEAKGALYGKYIPDEAWARMMIWDAPLSKQPENVKAAFEKLGIKARDLEWTQEPNAKRWHAKPESGLDVLITETPGLGPHSDPYFTMFVNKKEMGTYASINEAKAEADFRYGDAGMDGEAAYRKLADAVDNADIKHDIVSAATKELLQRRGLDMNGMDDYIENTSPRSYAEELASVILHQAGVPGHRFLDGETRAAGWDSPKARFNVVLYSDELGRVAWEARNNDTEWVTANGRGQVFKETDELLDRSFYVAKVDGEDVGQAFTVEEATRMVERELNGQLYSRSGDGDKIPAPDPIEDTTLPNARLLADQADEEIATANELSQGFLPAVECAMQVGG